MPTWILLPVTDGKNREKYVQERYSIQLFYRVLIFPHGHN